MKLRISRHFDPESIAALFTNEPHQLGGELKIAVLTHAHAGRKIATQRHHALDAHGLVFLQQAADFLLAGADAGNMWRGVKTSIQNRADGVHRAFPGAAASAIGHGKIFWIQLAQLGKRVLQILPTLVGFGWEKFEG